MAPQCPVSLVPSACPPRAAAAAAEAAASAGSPGSHRIRGACLLAPCLGLILAAALLSPRAAGHGTHTQLGLPGCSFLIRTGCPCPSCGLTTSMAFMARGRPGRAFHSHPFGAALFAAAVLFAGVGAGELLTGRDLVRHLRPSVWWCALGVGGLLAGWGWKLLTGFLSGELPMT